MASAPEEAELKLAKYIIDDCAARGLKHFFGIPGSGSPMDLMKAAHAAGLQFVITAHESSAVISAAYYGLFKGTAGLMVGIKGVGMGNAVGGAVNASTERVPVVVVCEARSSTVPRALPLAQHMGADQASFFGDVLRYAGAIAEGGVAQTWQAATSAAAHGRPGASFVDLPGNLGQAAVDAAAAAQLAARVAEGEAAWAAREGAAEDAIAAGAAALLPLGDRRPVVIVGADVVRDGAVAELAAFVAAVGGAVLTTMEARGAYPEDDDRWAGVLVSRTSAPVIETKLLAAADSIILVGVDQYMVENPFLKGEPTVLELAADAAYGSLTETRALLAGADPDPSFWQAKVAQNAGEETPDAVRLNGHLRKTLAALTAALLEESSSSAAAPAAAADDSGGGGGAPAPAPAPGGNGGGFPAPEVRAIRQGVLDSCFARPATDGLTANDIIAITRKHLPAEGVLFAETGVFVCMLEHLWSAPLPRTFFGSSGGRSMGLTVPALLGAKLAAPEKQMVGFGGDGSLLMRLGELESFGRCADQLKGTPLIIINDQALGTMQARQRSRKMEPYSLKFHPVEYGAIATACGMGSATVTNAAEFEAALVEAMKPDSPPTLIDARVDARAYQDSFAATIGNLE